MLTDQHIATEPHDIVQAIPGTTEWGPCLVVVTEVKSWGIQGFTSIPRGGDAYIRLKHNEYELTGGRAVFVPREEDRADV